MRGVLEVDVAQSAATSFHHHQLLSVFQYFADVLVVFNRADDGAQWYFDVGILAVLAEALVFLSVAAMLGENVLGVT